MRIGIFVFSIILIESSLCETLKGCLHPSGKRGYCVHRSRCEYSAEIHKQIAQPTLEAVNEVFISTFLCDSQKIGGRLRDTVCCPCAGVFTNDYDILPYDDCGCDSPSTCVKYSECPEFLSLIRLLASTKHLIQGAWWLVINSWRCDNQNPALFRVCCPSKLAMNPGDDRYEPSPVPSQRSSYVGHPNRNLVASPSSCGKARTPSIRSRIVGGQDALLGQFPALANLGYERIHPRYGTVLGVVYECGGVLIGSRYVLTAAHCTTDLPKGRRGPVTVRLGEFDLTKQRDCSGGICAPETQNFLVDEIVNHPNYTAHPSLHNDIALIRLSKPYVKNGFVNEICLPFSSNFNYSARTSLKPFIFVAGWGATDRRGRKFPKILQYLELDLFTFKECAAIYQKYGSNLSDTGMQMCAGGDFGRDSCGGDSGSALMLEDPKKGSWTTIGVVSFGPRRCGQEGVPAVYTKVEYFLDWILDNVY